MDKYSYYGNLLEDGLNGSTLVEAMGAIEMSM